MTTETRPPARIPAGIWVLGFVSMLMDISSEMIHSLLPLFMVTILGASTIAVGLVEGLAEFLALVVKVFSGTLSDYLGKRKALAVFGYALGAFTKPLFALAPGVSMVLTARLLIESEKECGEPPAMRWWRTSRRRSSEAQRSVCGSRWILSARSLAHWLLLG